MLPPITEIEDALSELESRFPGYGLVLTIFDDMGGETYGNRGNEITAAVIEGLYKNRIQRPTSKDTLQ